MGHAEDDLRHAERAAALDDLFQRRNHGFAAIKTEALGAGEFEIDEFLEALGLDELVEDRALALAGETDLLAGAFDARLQPGFFRGIGNVHELVADRAAIGAAQDGQHFRDRREFEPEHAVDEDLAGVIGLGEAEMRGVQRLVLAPGLQAERVEIGVEMAAHAIGADHHDGADGIARRLAQFGVGIGRPCAPS